MKSKLSLKTFFIINVFLSCLIFVFISSFFKSYYYPRINECCFIIHNIPTWKNFSQLVKNLKDEDKNIRLKTIASLTYFYLNKMSQKVVPLLISALNDNAWEIRKHTIKSLIQFITSNEITRIENEILILALNKIIDYDDNREVHFFARLASFELKLKKENSFSVAVNGLKDCNIFIRYKSVEYLEKVDIKTKKVLNLLLLSYLSGDKKLCSKIDSIIKKTTGKRTTEILKSYLKNFFLYGLLFVIILLFLKRYFNFGFFFIKRQNTA